MKKDFDISFLTLVVVIPLVIWCLIIIVIALTTGEMISYNVNIKEKPSLFFIAIFLNAAFIFLYYSIAKNTLAKIKTQKNISYSRKILQELIYLLILLLKISIAIVILLSVVIIIKSII